MDGRKQDMELQHYDVNRVFPAPRLSRGFVEKNYSKGMHTQSFYEINIVLRGSALHRIGERQMTVGAGDTFIIPPNVPHGYEGGEGFDVYHLLLSPKYLERYASSLMLLPAFSSLFLIDPLLRSRTQARLHFALDACELASLEPHLQSLSEHNRKKTAFGAVMSDGEALILIASLCAIYEQKACLGTSAPSDRAFYESLSYIYEHYRETIGIDTLCRMANMSRTAYLAKFRRVTDHTPAELQTAYRVEVGKRLLRQTGDSVSSIAIAVGCYDVSHFVRIFKKATGMTPGEYRQAAE